ncbi:metal-dependent hydrolase [Halomonas sp. 18H]|uniref:metal-dependent hydrolase n=1 Tax=Halomonas almeriensis TaxID=308163 RepID=UPI0022324C21|nr:MULTISPECIES: metal-dependent hydrolase [Halomonas]MCW4152941.1 metal-dependent hydrolase [Halomonas sp. 18H]MDN3553131.1 metal-dependent hydrolase [Halomonas almeriensis]
MANFGTHISVAAGSGCVLALGGWHLGLWTPWQAWPLMLLTTLGGIMPDIDSDHSHSVRLVFGLLAFISTASAAWLLQARLDFGYWLMACAATYLMVRYLLAPLFKRFSVHRGVWHSLLAALFVAWTGSALSHGVLGQPAWLAWTHGTALLLGCLVHLTLDEVYSVDLEGMRLKRSFGTALKLFDYDRPWRAVVLLLLMAAMLPWLPSWQSLAAVGEQWLALWPQ